MLEDCRTCKYGCILNANGKKLCKCVATSILVKIELLESNKRLVKVAENGENKYYLVRGTNTVIFHVEDDYAVLIDYRVKLKNLPDLLKVQHFTIQRTAGKNRNQRDWVMCGGESLAYVIRRVIYGNWYVSLNRRFKRTMNHQAETCDERWKNTGFINKDDKRKSHRMKIDVETANDLDDFIDDIQQNEGVNDGIYFDKQNEKKRKSRHFVH